jgi:hypothetical protein
MISAFARSTCARSCSGIGEETVVPATSRRRPRASGPPARRHSASGRSGMCGGGARRVARRPSIKAREPRVRAQSRFRPHRSGRVLVTEPATHAHGFHFFGPPPVAGPQSDSRYPATRRTHTGARRRASDCPPILRQLELVARAVIAHEHAMAFVSAAQRSVTRMPAFLRLASTTRALWLLGASQRASLSRSVSSSCVRLRSASNRAGLG